MENKVQVFSNPEFGEIRVLEISGEPWFVGKEVAKSLGHKNPERAIRKFVSEEDKGVTDLVTPSGKDNRGGGIQVTTLINESGFYSLVFASKLPRAKEFKRWVTSEVLPSIRKTGSYSLGRYSNPIPSNLEAVKVKNVINEACKFAMKLRRDLGIDKEQASIVAIQLMEEAYDVDLSFLKKAKIRIIRNNDPIDLPPLPF